jgi:very-short-patch-repair endonuclease
MLHYRTDLKEKARSLRKNMTDAENLLWLRLKGKQIKGHQFYRQKPIGEYIADFYSASARLVIEVDGGQHFDAEGVERDLKRDTFLVRRGLRILRYSNHDVLTNIEGVVEDVWRNT